MPPDQVFAAVERLHAELAEVRRLLTDPATTSVRVVLTPESVVVAESRRTLTSLALHGYRVDGVVVNRIFPADDGEFVSRWAAAQSEQLSGITASFDSVPIWRAPYLPAEPVGLAPLLDLARDVYGDTDPLAVAETSDPMSVEQLSTDEFVLSVALPHADRREVDVVRKGDELVLTVGSQRRVLALPSALRRCTTEGAALREGRLRVRFRPDPALWMRT
jgi:arsenite-transporting ATPase